MNLSMQKYLFCGYSKWQRNKFSAQGLNRGVSSNWYHKEGKPCEIYKRISEVYREVDFSQMNVYESGKHWFCLYKVKYHRKI